MNERLTLELLTKAAIFDSINSLIEEFDECLLFNDLKVSVEEIIDDVQNSKVIQEIIDSQRKQNISDELIREVFDHVDLVVRTIYEYGLPGELEEE